MADRKKSAYLNFSILAVALVFNFISGTATDQGSLVFLDSRPIVLSWDQIVEGKNVEVINIGRQRIDNLRIELIGFNFQSNGSQIGEAGIFNLSSAVFHLENEEKKSIPIQAMNGSALDPGEYNGVLAVYGNGVGMMQKNVTIKVPNKYAKVISLVDEVVLNAERRRPWPFSNEFPWSKEIYLDKPYLIIRPNEGDNRTKVGDIIGTVYYENNLGLIKIDGEEILFDNNAEIAKLPIRLENVKDVGTYKGKLNISDTSDEGAEVSVQVNITDNWAIPLIIILLGVVFSFGAQYILYRWRVSWDLKQRRDALIFRFGYDGRHRRRDSKNAKGCDPSIRIQKYAIPGIGDIEEYQRKFDTSLKVFEDSNWLFDTESEDFKKLITILETAENDARILGCCRDDSGSDLSPFERSLTDLKASLHKIALFIHHNDLGLPGKPAFAEPIIELIKGGKLKVGKAQEIKEKAEGYIPIINDWLEMAEKIRRCENWAQLLLKAELMTERDKRHIYKVKARIAKAKREILEARDLALLAAMGTHKDLEYAYACLAYLAGKHDVWEPKIAVAKAGVELETSEAMNWIAKWINDAVTQNLEPMKVVEIEKRIRGLGIWFVFAFATVISIFSGMIALLYFGKTFGTWTDYLTAFLMGAGTETIMQQLNDKINQIRKPLKS